MSRVLARLDARMANNGRVLVPGHVRRALGMTEHMPLLLTATENALIITRLDGTPFVASPAQIEEEKGANPNEPD